MSATDAPVLLSHSKWGKCRLVRVDGTDWLVRFDSNGKTYRIPPSCRPEFTRVGGGQFPARVSIRPTVPPRQEVLAVVDHEVFGIGEVLRVEASDWIVKFRSSGSAGHHLIGPSDRKFLRVIEDHTLDRTFTRQAVAPEIKQSPGNAAGPTSQVRGPATGIRPQPVGRVAGTDSPRLGARRLIESLRNGLPPANADARKIAVGGERVSSAMKAFLADIDEDGGRATVIRGMYGQGKTFALRVLAEMAIEEGYVVARTEIDATENPLNKPHHIYRDLMAHLRVPDSVETGRGAVRMLVSRVRDRLSSATRSIAYEWQACDASREILLKDTGCLPLSWLLSDPLIGSKDDLVGLLLCDPGVHTPTARERHRTPGSGRDWPVFNAGTQGDFASYLLSGLGRLCRAVGYRGLVIVMDEMEKWQDLNWKQQSQAGNLLGGLIWGATAPEGKRGETDEPTAIAHSRRSGGFPFTTLDRNFVGVAIAMTPRGEEGPERLWGQYGILEFVELPQVTRDMVGEFCAKIAPHYALAIGQQPPHNGQVRALATRATSIWRKSGNHTARSAVQAAIQAFDEANERESQVCGE